MNPPSEGGPPRRTIRVLLTLAWILLLAARAAERTGDVWRDVPAVLAACGLGLAWGKGRHANLAAAAWLLGLYVSAQGPRILEVLGTW